MNPFITGKSSCTTLPQYANSKIALAYLFVEGLSKNAKKFAKRDNKDITTTINCLSFCSYAVIYRVLVNDFNQAIVLANRQIVHLFGPVDDMDKLNFYRACLILSEKLNNSGKEWSGLPEIPELADTRVNSLYQYFKTKFDDLLKAFDKRNGNEIFSKRERALYNHFMMYEVEANIK